MLAVEIVIGFLVVATVIALYLWSRRVERDVDFDSLQSPQTDDQRRANQLGIGLISGQGVGGTQ